MSTTSINHATLEAFLDLSAAVTGFSTFRLLATGQAQTYVTAVQRVIGEATLQELLTKFRGVASVAASDASATDDLLRRDIFSDDKLGPIARNIVKLWFIGTWYQLPPEWRDAFGTSEHDVTFVASPAAYTEGLLWPTIGANPSGAKGPGYGTWAEPPRIPRP